MYDDIKGVSYPLTPSHLINGRNVTLTPNDRHFEVVSTLELLTKRAKYQRKILANFTKRWKNEYLPSLRELANRNDDVENILSVGELVIAKNEQTKRSFWKIGKILQLIASKDGKIRSAKIESDKGTTSPVRPLQYLVPLELRSHDELLNDSLTSEPKKDEVDSVAKGNDHLNTRPRRNAAVIGELIRKNNLY